MSATTSRPLPAPLSLAGKRVLVTGAANGIGRATALVLASLGADLLLADRAPLDTAKAETEAAGARCEARQGDLTDDTFLEGLFNNTRLNAVAHCAAIISAKPWREDPDWRARFARTMDVNVRVPLTLGALAIDHIAANGGGAIVLVGSVAGRTGGTAPTTPPDYAASKGAVHALIKLLSRQAVTRGVLVNGVAPGPVETAMTRGVDLSDKVPMRRMGKPEELGWPIAFLLTPAASYLSGALIDVNGGAFVG